MKRIMLFTILTVQFSTICNAEVTVPYKFKSGQPAIADHVNANFNAIENTINKLSSTLERLDQQIKALQGRSSELKSKISSFGQLTTRFDTFDQELQSIRRKNSELEIAINQIRQSVSHGVPGSAKAGVYGKSPGTGSGFHGVYGETQGDWGWASGVYGRVSKTNAIGVTGWHDGGGAGVYGYSKNGVAVAAMGESGNLIEAWDTSPRDLRFSVSNNGEVRADGRFRSGGADIAEILPAAGGLEPKDVLVIGPDGRLRRSENSFAANVAGVYSTNPGFVGGDDDNNDFTGKAILAVLGVVPVKASAENGPIRPGMLLVTADTPSHAMYAGVNPPVGTVIGKALESLDNGTGTIRMLVMLH